MNTSVVGTSVSGLGTCLVLPEYGVVLDIGLCLPPSLKYSTVLVTHAHIDHLAGAVQHAATRDLLGRSPTRFIVPPAIAGGLTGIMESWASLQGRFRYEVVPLAVGEELPLGRDLVVRPFATDHGLPSQGYALVRRGKRLKEAFRDLPGSEIRRLKSTSGIEVEEVVERVEVAYTGDTRVGVVDREPDVRNARLLIIEASFLGEIPREYAQKQGHTHLDELAERADLFENEQIVLIHFSNRHDAAAIRAAVEQLPVRLRERVSPLCTVSA